MPSPPAPVGPPHRRPGPGAALLRRRGRHGQRRVRPPRLREPVGSDAAGLRTRRARQGAGSESLRGVTPSCTAGQACTVAAGWRRPPGSECCIWVNLAAPQVADPDLFGTVKRILDRTGLSPDQLGLELTETTLMHRPSPPSRCWSRCTTSAWPSRSTTSTPATHRCRTCTASRWMYSRSTSRS